MKRIYVLVFLFIFYSISYVYSYSQMPEFLCESGIKFYQQGRYDSALEEFKKALLIQPNYGPALRYIQMIEQRLNPIIEPKEIIPPKPKPPAKKKQNDKVGEFLDILQEEKDNPKDKLNLPRLKSRDSSRAESTTPFIPGLKPRDFCEGLKDEQLSIKKKDSQKATPIVTSSSESIDVPDEKLAFVKEASLTAVALDSSLSNIKQPIEIQQGKDIVITGKNISRFLITQPDLLKAERKGSDELLVTAKEIGYTYLHIWDENGRWTLEILGVLPRPEGPTVEELMRLDEERAGTFKVRYSLDWHTYEQGSGMHTLKRQSYSWFHNLNIIGATPYGDIDSTTVVRSLNTSTDLTYFTLGLENGVWSKFKGFSVRAFDLYPSFSNLAFSGGSSSIRGWMVKSPAFNNKLDYTFFWGREGGGRYGNLSPGLQKARQSFLDGININYYPAKKTNLGFTFANGYGRDRPKYLYHNAYDLILGFPVGPWNLNYEVGYDTKNYANLFSGNYIRPKMFFSYELRGIAKNYFTITGEAWRRGQTGGLFNLNLNPTSDLRITNRLDVYKDKLYPAEDNDNRWNQDYDLNTCYTIDPTSSLRLNYTLQNDLGQISQTRYLTPGIGYSKSFNFIRNISSYVDYRHQENKNYTGPSMSYINDNISLGIRFSLVGELFYFLNSQWNWLQESYTGNHYQPHVFETGLDLNSQIFTSPFYQNIRFTYRDEQDTASVLSFLSGEDYVEGYAELTYRPVPDKEAYCSTRIRNVWAENPNANKRMEADFNAGMRYLWDTGLRWESMGNIEGYVFKDLNSDGLRQRNEAPAEGIKLWLGKNKSATTDLFGHYKFKNVKGKKAFVTIDARTIPAGFVITVPQTQEVTIEQGRTSRIDFGIASRSEISGVVFYDLNADSQYNRDEIGIKDAVLTLEDGTKAITDSDGRYTFRNVSVGEHTVTLDLRSLPVIYLPKVAMMKKVSLSEGLTYIYNIPLRKIKE